MEQSDSVRSLLRDIDPYWHEEQEKEVEARKRPMSVRLDAFAVLRLERVAAHCGMTKTTLAQQLLESAAHDAATYFCVEPTEEEYIAIYKAERSDQAAKAQKAEKVAA
jgi:hypothetical protein